MKHLAIACLFVVLPVAATAADAPSPLLASSNAFYGQLKDVVLRSAAKMPEENFAFKPSPDVRSFGQLLGHIADAQYVFCGILATGKPVMKGIEKTATTRADLVSALKESFAYCDVQYQKLTDADAAASVSWFGQPRTKLSILDFNVAHGYEHYGNLVTYMRIKGVVPPSSEQNR